MFPRLGEKYHLEIEIVSKTRDDYRTAEYQATGLPIAPALILEDELLIQGRPITEEAFESAITRHLRTE